MIGFSRRQFATGLAAAGLGLNALLQHAAAQAAASPATRNLPRTYSGRTLKIVWGNSPAFISTAEFSKVFTPPPACSSSSPSFRPPSAIRR